MSDHLPLFAAQTPDGEPLCHGDDDRADNRRTRLAPRKGRGGPQLPPKIHSWLIRTTRVHASLCYLVRCFGRPAATDRGDTVEARAARRDRTLLYDVWTHATNELEQLRSELTAEMEPHPTDARPGSPEKVAELERRAASQQTLFGERDARL